MGGIQFKLDVFEGPLDLLLHLISKHKLNIEDIEISKLLEQYLLYIEEARQQDLELAGEFLEMAARLIYIKTVSLLPKPEEAQRAKQELQGALIEYALCQKAAAQLREMFQSDDIFVRRPARLPRENAYKCTHAPSVLARAYAMLDEARIRGQRLSERITDTVSQTKTVSVFSKMVYVLRQLFSGNSVSVASLYTDMTDRSARVATFLAVLELTKNGKIYLNDDNTMLTMCQRKGG